MCVCICASVCVCLSVCVHICVCVSMSVYVYVSLCVFLMGLLLCYQVDMLYNTLYLCSRSFPGLVRPSQAVHLKKICSFGLCISKVPEDSP